MSDEQSARLRVALAHHSYASPPHAESEQAVHQLATALRARGHEVTVLSARRLPIDPLLRRRGFTGPLGHLPATLHALLTGGFDLTHAFSAPDAAAALLWRRRHSRPVIYTCTEVLDRAALADGRMRQRLLTDAVERTDAVLAATEESRAALERWLAVDAAVLEAHDGQTHEHLYQALLERRSR